MADKVDLKMFRFIFFVALLFSGAVHLAHGEQFEEVCNCYERCARNYTTGPGLSVGKVFACQRGCRFFAIAMHTSNEEAIKPDSGFAHDSCVFSCKEAYEFEVEKAACIAGCSESEKGPCIMGEVKIPQLSFSLMSETDIVLNAVELDPDNVHTDPGLRKQIGVSEESLTEPKPKLPEIHFKDLPVKNGGIPVRTRYQASMKCPKFYGLDSKLEFKNGKFIVGDLYLFAGVFIFVILCFLLGHQMESKGVRKQQKGSRNTRKISKQRKDLNEPGNEKGRLVHEIIDYGADYVMEKSELKKNSGACPKFSRSITLVFHDDPKAPEQNQDYYIPEKVIIEDYDKFETVYAIDEKNFPDASKGRNNCQIF